MAKEETNPGVEAEAGAAMLRASRRLARLLADAEVLGDDELLSIQEQHPDEFLGDILVREGILPEGYLHGLLIRSLFVPWIAVDCCTMSPELRGLLSERLCRRRRLVPISRARDFLTVACVNPLDEEALNKVRDVTGMKVRPLLCSAQELEAFMKVAFSRPAEEESGTDDDEAGAESEGDAGMAAATAELVEQFSDEDAEGAVSKVKPADGQETEEGRVDAGVAAAAAELAGQLSAQMESDPRGAAAGTTPAEANDGRPGGEQEDEEPA